MMEWTVANVYVLAAIVSSIVLIIVWYLFLRK